MIVQNLNFEYENVAEADNWRKIVRHYDKLLIRRFFLMCCFYLSVGCTFVGFPNKEFTFATSEEQRSSCL